jgi:hypothetical protein
MLQIVNSLNGLVFHAGPTDERISAECSSDWQRILSLRARVADLHSVPGHGEERVPAWPMQQEFANAA